MSDSDSVDQKTTTKGAEESKLFVSPIADPLASDKLQKKLIKLIKKSMKDKTVKRGVKETVKAVAKGGKGYEYSNFNNTIVFALLLLTFLLSMSSLTFLSFARKRMLPTFTLSLVLRLVRPARQSALLLVCSSKTLPRKVRMRRNSASALNSSARETHTWRD